MGTSFVVTSDDALGHGVVRTSNALGWVTSENREGAVTSYAYDAAGNLKTLTDPLSNVTAWTYDGLDRVTQETNPLSQSRSFVYDLAGNLTQKTDRNGRVTQYVYDKLYRTTAEKWLSGGSLVRTLEFAYDEAGQLVSASDPAAEYAYQYDALGRLTSETQELAGLAPQVAFASQYNLTGARTQLAATVGGTADFLRTFARDARDRLTTLVEQGQWGNGVTRKEIGFSYDAADQLTGVSRFEDENGSPVAVAGTELAYDGVGRLTDLHHTGGGATLARYQYVYDAASRITQLTSHVDGLSAYGYNARDELTAADHASSGPPDG